ncbi:unnamed protein product [Fraxinus pennsylvanica]|uniref:Phospholipase D alpha 1 n=1 Tax=Fraxinus pennsylvanica TaxID=56036 RepID=A0AAD2EEB7_9LAMI|nr:unnamed protein product [Fraxinus pennsylvanica]
MDNNNYHSLPPYQYSTYGYPHVPPPPNQKNPGSYPGHPPPGSVPYPYPQYSHYPPPPFYNTSGSGPLNYPYSGPMPLSAPPATSGPLENSYHPHSPVSWIPTSSTNNSRPLQPPDNQANVPPRISGEYSSYYHYQDSSSSVSGPTGNSDHINDGYRTRPPVYPSIDGLMENVHLSNNCIKPSAPASPPSPSASLPSSPPNYHSGPLPMTNNYNSVGAIYGHLNSSSRWETSSTGQMEHPSVPASSNSATNAETSHAQNMQIMAAPSPKGSLKVLLLHGNMDIWVYEARNLPNMDMFHKTIGDMFNNLKNTSDPYVSITVTGATIGRTFVIRNNENPVWTQHFNLPVAHYAAEVHFVVKDNDVVGSQFIGTVTVPVEHLYGGAKIEGFFPILSTSGKPCKAGAILYISIQYTPIENLSIYHHGIGAGPDYRGVPGTYFPLRRGGMVTLYQDAHVPDGCLPILKLENGMQYEHEKCWHDIFDAIRQARRLIYITGWSVWHKVRLVRDDNSVSCSTLGELLRSKSQEGVRVLLLVWDDPTSGSILGYRTDGVMQTHDEETRRFFKNSSVQVLLCPRVAGKRYSWVKQREVGVIYTHHQKTVIVDADARNNRRRITAFLGGLDLCNGQYDTPQHHIFRTLKTWHTDDYHNPTYAGSVTGGPREPWHDLHCKIDGPAAYDVLTNFEEWIPDVLGLSDAPCVSDDDPQSWHIQVFHSIDSNSVRGFPKDPKEATMRNLVCGKNVLIDMSIHTAYVEAIRAAQHFIYVENQYFIGSSYNWSSYKDVGANNLIPIEIALKIANKIRAHERFAAYIVIPMWAEGNPTGAATQRILFWQHKTMQMMFETIYKALMEVGLEDAYSPQDYLNFYCLGNREALDTDYPSEHQSAANTPQVII